MTKWLIRVHNGCAYIWKRKFFLGMIAIPWRFHGGTWVIMTPDANDNVLDAAIEYIKGQEQVPTSITIHLAPGDEKL